MEKRNSTQSRNPMLAPRRLTFLGGTTDSGKLDGCPPRLYGGGGGGGGAMVDGYAGGFHLPRTTSDEYGETSLLLPKTSDNAGRRRMCLQPSPSPTRKSASSFPISPPSEMFCSHGATSDSYSPSLEVLYLFLSLTLSLSLSKEMCLKLFFLSAFFPFRRRISI